MLNAHSRNLIGRGDPRRTTIPNVDITATQVAIPLFQIDRTILQGDLNDTNFNALDLHYLVSEFDRTLGLSVNKLMETGIVQMLFYAENSAPPSLYFFHAYQYVGGLLGARNS